MRENKKYFNNLDGLRFVAAMTVAFSHFETIKSYLPLSFLKNRFIEHSAQMSVTFFFVLSGFLIMWWFLEDTNGDVQKMNIKYFYINRVSRTWPLYFFILLISIIISLISGSFFSDPFSLKRYLLYLFWMPNLTDVWYKSNIYLGQTWSLAVEEFFYLSFPFFLIQIGSKNLQKHIMNAIVFFLVVATCINPIFIQLFIPGLQINNWLQYLIIFFERYRIYSFLLGALVAVILYYRTLDKLNVNAKKLKGILLITCSFVAIMFFLGLTFSFLTHQVYSIIFATLILLLSYTDYYSKLLNHKLLLMGGKISYGIYMLHMFVVMCLFNQGAFLFQFDSPIISIITSWIFLLLSVYVLSYLSFHFFENPLRAWARRYYLKKGEK